jgi:hypothetical protein
MQKGLPVYIPAGLAMGGKETIVYKTAYYLFRTHWLRGGNIIPGLAGRHKSLGYYFPPSAFS